MYLQAMQKGGGMEINEESVRKKGMSRVTDDKSELCPGGGDDLQL